MSVFFIPQIVSDQKKITRLQTSTVNDSATLLFVGDVMLGRNVELLSERQGEGYPFSMIADFLSRFDAVVGNLEGPLLSSHTRTPSGSTRFSFKANKAKLLFSQNIRVVSQANNHTYDYGRDGFLESLLHLRLAGISAVGDSYDEGGQSYEEIVIEGHRLGFLGLNAVQRSPNLNTISEILQILRSRNEYVVVLVHWGDEYEKHSNAKQQELAHFFIRGGADLVVGHHPHVVQEVEKFEGGVIFYSLGNFIFDQYFSKDVQEGLAVEAQFRTDGILFTLHPVLSRRSVPELMTQGRSLWISELDAQSGTLEKSDLGGTIFVPKKVQ